MPRDIPVGNGRLLVNFDHQYRIRDFYFPQPGLQNQSCGNPFHFGVWADGAFQWLADDEWTRQLKYLPETLVTDVRLRSKKLGLEIVSNDAVDFYENVFVRRMTVRNLTDRPRDVRVFFHHDFCVGETEDYDTAYYDPSTVAVIHYEGDCYFLASCMAEGKYTFDQWATGNKGFAGAEGTWRDAEDGRLSNNPIAQGSVDSTIGLNLAIEPGGQQTVYYWIAAGRSHHDVRIIDAVVRSKKPERLLQRTIDYGRAWVNKEAMNFGRLPAEVVDAFKRSLLIIRTNLAESGAILAANDGDVRAFNRDTYSYMWPRDGALVAYALDIAGYSSLTRRFYRFAKNLITRDGYFLHKYRPEGTPGSSWHPWFSDGEIQLPIQEDETALMLWGLWKHYSRHRDIEFIGELYSPVIKQAADFMLRYRDPQTGLPQPSWDLWEERRGVHTYTVATVWAGLQAAAHFAALFGETALAGQYAAVARDIRQAALDHLFVADLGRFARMLRPSDSGEANGAPAHDTTVDSSLAGVWYFGMLPPDHPAVVGTMKAIYEKLWAHTPVGGLARYEGDYYYRVFRADEPVAGNPWPLCTLWLAQYEIASAKTEDDLGKALAVIEWVLGHALESGVMPEQVDPYTGEPLSVSPLTWSHAQFVTAVVEYLRRLHDLQRCGACEQPIFDYERRESDEVPSRISEFAPPAKDQ